MCLIRVYGRMMCVSHQGVWEDDVCVCLIRVYGRMMESVQEACQEMGWAKKMVSGWAMKKGLEGNMNKQHK